MKERDVVAVEPVDEDEWGGDVSCMSASEDMSSACNRPATKELSIKYDGEPDKTFFTCLCDDCASEYLRRWDKAQIFGDEALEEESEYRVS